MWLLFKPTTIIPDKTPNANRQILEISTKKPGFEVDMLMVPKETPPAKTSFLDFLLNGRPDDCIYLPFDSLHINKETTTVYLIEAEGTLSVRTRLSIIKNFWQAALRPFDRLRAQGPWFLQLMKVLTYYIRSHCVKHRKFLLGMTSLGATSSAVWGFG